MTAVAPSLATESGKWFSCLCITTLYYEVGLIQPRQVELRLGWGCRKGTLVHPAPPSYQVKETLYF